MADDDELYDLLFEGFDDPVFAEEAAAQRQQEGRLAPTQSEAAASSAMPTFEELREERVPSALHDPEALQHLEMPTDVPDVFGMIGEIGEYEQESESSAEAASSAQIASDEPPSMTKEMLAERRRGSFTTALDYMLQNASAYAHPDLYEQLYAPFDAAGDPHIADLDVDEILNVHANMSPPSIGETREYYTNRRARTDYQFIGIKHQMKGRTQALFPRLLKDKEHAFDARDRWRRIEKMRLQEMGVVHKYAVTSSKTLNDVNVLGFCARYVSHPVANFIGKRVLLSLQSIVKSKLFEQMYRSWIMAITAYCDFMCPRYSVMCYPSSAHQKLDLSDRQRAVFSDERDASFVLKDSLYNTSWIVDVVPPRQSTPDGVSDKPTIVLTLRLRAHIGYTFVDSKYFPNVKDARVAQHMLLNTWFSTRSVAEQQERRHTPTVTERTTSLADTFRWRIELLYVMSKGFQNLFANRDFRVVFHVECSTNAIPFENDDGRTDTFDVARVGAVVSATRIHDYPDENTFKRASDAESSRNAQTSVTFRTGDRFGEFIAPYVWDAPRKKGVKSNRLVNSVTYVRGRHAQMSAREAYGEDMSQSAMQYALETFGLYNEVCSTMMCNASWYHQFIRTDGTSNEIAMRDLQRRMNAPELSHAFEWMSFYDDHLLKSHTNIMDILRHGSHLRELRPVDSLVRRADGPPEVVDVPVRSEVELYSDMFPQSITSVLSSDDSFIHSAATSRAELDDIDRDVISHLSERIIDVGRALHIMVGMSNTFLYTSLLDYIGMQGDFLAHAWQRQRLRFIRGADEQTFQHSSAANKVLIEDNVDAPVSDEESIAENLTRAYFEGRRRPSAITGSNHIKFATAQKTTRIAVLPHESVYRTCPAFLHHAHKVVYDMLRRRIGGSYMVPLRDVWHSSDDKAVLDDVYAAHPTSFSLKEEECSNHALIHHGAVTRNHDAVPVALLPGNALYECCKYKALVFSHRDRQRKPFILMFPHSHKSPAMDFAVETWQRGVLPEYVPPHIGGYLRGPEYVTIGADQINLFTYMLVNRFML